MLPSSKKQKETPFFVFLKKKSNQKNHKPHHKNLSTHHHHHISIFIFSTGKGGITTTFPHLAAGCGCTSLNLNPFAALSKDTKRIFYNSYWTSHGNTNFSQWNKEKKLDISTNCINRVSHWCYCTISHSHPVKVIYLSRKKTILAMLMKSMTSKKRASLAGLVNILYSPT